MESDTQKPHLAVVVVFWVFLLTFFGGGLAVFINLFVPFLTEAAYAIIAISLFAELLILLVVGKSVQIISSLRQQAEALPAEPVQELPERQES